MLRQEFPFLVLMTLSLFTRGKIQNDVTSRVTVLDAMTLLLSTRGKIQIDVTSRVIVLDAMTLSLSP